MKKRDTTPHAQIGNPMYLWAKQNPVTPHIRIRMSNADVYLLSWLLLASEHCDRTTGLQPVNLQPNLIHQFILFFIYNVIPFDYRSQLSSVKLILSVGKWELLLAGSSEAPFVLCSWLLPQCHVGNHSHMIAEGLRPH